MTVVSVLAEINALPCKEDGRVYIMKLDKLVPRYRNDNGLARSLWTTGDMNARQFAVRIAEPLTVTEECLELWLPDLDSWDICDAFCGLVARSPFAETKALSWVHLDGEYQRRAGFALIAQMAWAKNDFTDGLFIQSLENVERYAPDERYYVKKSVNWALRDIGKRNDILRLHAQALANRLAVHSDKTSRWVGKHRIKEIA